MKFIKILFLFIFAVPVVDSFAQTFSIYDSTYMAQSLTGTRDIRFNTQFHKNSGAVQTLKGISMSNLYKALKGKLASDGLISGGGQIDSIQIYHDSILIAYASGLQVDRDTIRIPTVIPTLGGDVTGTLGSVAVVDNSHNHNNSTITTDILSSIEGVTNDGGNVDLVASGVITITGNDGANTITFTVPHPDTTFSYGDLSGGLNSGTVRGLRGRAISASAPSDGQVYTYNSGTLTWVPTTLAAADTTLSGDVTGGLNTTVVGNDSHTHSASTITTDIVSSINNVYNDGGNINIVSANSLIAVSSSDVSNTVTLTAVSPDTTLSGDVTGGLNSTVVGDNSHNHSSSTITTNIVSSINGVSNDGGNVAIVGTNGISISSNNTTDTITVSGTPSPYLVYTALLSQADSSDPVAIVLANTLSGDIIWTRTTTGVYFGTLSGAFTNNLTTVSCNYGIVSGDASIITGFRSNSNVIRVQTYKASDKSLSEMKGSLIFIEIRVYIGA